MRFKIAAAALMLSVFSTSYVFASNSPKELYNDGDWTLEDSSKYDPNGGCFAFTTAEVGNTIWRLEFFRPRNKLAFTEVNIRQQGRGALSWTATLNDGSVLSFANGGQAGRSTLFWNIPQKSDDLVSQLEGRRSLKLKPADGTRDVRLEFSADGFRNVHRKMEEKCLNNLPLIDSAFEDSFFTKKDTINPANISADAVKELRRLISVAYDVTQNIKANSNDINDLRNKFSNQLNEASALNSLIDRLTSSLIPSTIKNSQNNDALEASSRGNLDRINSEITKQNASVASAQVVLNSAQAKVDPLQGEHDSRSNNAGNARRQSNSEANRLNQIDSGIASANSRINQLSSEAGSLQNNNDSLDGQVRVARGEAIRADQDYRSFEPRREVRRRLEFDRAYNDAQRSIQNYQRNLDITERALNDAKSKSLVKQAELNACQSQPRVGFFDAGISFRLPAQSTDTMPRGPHYHPPGEQNTNPTDDRGNGSGPGRGGNRPAPTTPTSPAPTAPVPTPTAPAPTQPTAPTPIQPTAPTPAPAPDCSAQSEALRQARVVEQSIQGQRNEAATQLNNIDQGMRNIELRVNAEVERERDNLARRAAETQNRANGLQLQMDSNSRRIAQISAQDIPQQQNILYSLQNERPGVQASYNQDAPNSDRLESELAGFESRTGWNSKVQAVNDATQALSFRRSELNNSLSLKAQTESTISRCGSERSRLANELSNEQQQLSQSNTRLVDVNKSLEPFNQQKSDLEKKGSDLKNQLAGLSTQFESQLPH